MSQLVRGPFIIYGTLMSEGSVVSPTLCPPPPLQKGTQSRNVCCLRPDEANPHSDNRVGALFVRFTTCSRFWAHKAKGGGGLPVPSSSE